MIGLAGGLPAARSARHAAPRVLCRLLLCCCLLTSVLGAGARRLVEPRPESRYADLAVWGRTHGFTAVNRGTSLEVQLTNRSVSLQFKADSRRMVLDGVDHRLTLPVRKQNGAFLIALRDIQTTLEPILNPPRRPPTRTIRTVAVNAGHGGKDPGNIEGRRQEKHYTLLLAGELRRALERAGLRVVLIRGDDHFVELDKRPAKAAEAKADLYISLHFNAVGGPGASEVSGAETYCLTPAGASSSNDTENHGGPWHPGNRFDRDNVLLAHLVHQGIVGGTDLSDRGVRRARFKELTLLDMPGVLVEGGYMTHGQDAASIYSPAGRTALARGVADGVLAYKRLVERKTTEP